MEKLDKKIIIIVIGAVTILGILFFAKYFFQNQNSQISDDVPVKYTLDDFPERGKYLDDEAAERFIKQLNNRYYALETGTDERTVHQNWIDIGLFKKAFGDLVGAEEAWIQAASLIPEPWLAYGNLADLYLYRTKNLEKAEELYLKAIEFKPNNYTFYEGLANLYRYEWADTHKNKVEGVMLRAIEVDPLQAKSYYNYLISFFEDEGNSAKVKYYNNKLGSL